MLTTVLTKQINDYTIILTMSDKTKNCQNNSKLSSTIKCENSDCDENDEVENDSTESHSDNNNNNNNNTSTTSNNKSNVPIVPNRTLMYLSSQPRNNKCAWCDRQRERNDLCNRCRQKVESRARTLNEQKMMGDCRVVQKIASFVQENVNFNQIQNISQFCQSFVQTFPFLMLRFQAENTYRGKKGNACWNVPESTIRSLMKQIYTADSEHSSDISNKDIKSLRRTELCQVLENTAFKKIRALTQQYQLQSQQAQSQSQSQLQMNYNPQTQICDTRQNVMNSNAKYSNNTGVGLINTVGLRNSQMTSMQPSNFVSNNNNSNSNTNNNGNNNNSNNNNNNNNNTNCNNNGNNENIQRQLHLQSQRRGPSECSLMRQEPKQSSMFDNNTNCNDTANNASNTALQPHCSLNHLTNNVPFSLMNTGVMNMSSMPPILPDNSNGNNNNNPSNNSGYNCNQSYSNPISVPFRTHSSVMTAMSNNNGNNVNNVNTGMNNSNTNNTNNSMSYAPSRGMSTQMSTNQGHATQTSINMSRFDPIYLTNTSNSNQMAHVQSQSHPSQPSQSSQSRPQLQLSQISQRQNQLQSQTQTQMQWQMNNLGMSQQNLNTAIAIPPSLSLPLTSMSQTPLQSKHVQQTQMQSRMHTQTQQQQQQHQTQLQSQNMVNGQAPAQSQIQNQNSLDSSNSSSLVCAPSPASLTNSNLTEVTQQQQPQQTGSNSMNQNIENESQLQSNLNLNLKSNTNNPQPRNNENRLTFGTTLFDTNSIVNANPSMDLPFQDDVSICSRMDNNNRMFDEVSAMSSVDFGNFGNFGNLDAMSLISNVNMNWNQFNGNNSQL